jgi:periplasmic protein TonB
LTLRHNSFPFIEDREFKLILTGSFAFYLILVFLVYFIPVDLNKSVLKFPPQARKITMMIPRNPIVTKPLPPPPVVKPVNKNPSNPPIPTKAIKKPLPLPTLERKKPETIKEMPSPLKLEEIERKKEEALKLQRANELEKNKEVAKNKFASLFGNAPDDVLQNKNLNVIGTKKSYENKEPHELSGVNPTDNLQIPIKNTDADQILNELPLRKNSQNLTSLGEHETKHFGPAGDGLEKTKTLRSSEEFEKYFKAYEGRLKSFYDKTIQSEPSLKGIMVVRIFVAADGTVIKCEILSSSISNKKFENEIVRLIQEQFRFSKIAQGEEYHVRSLNFHPEN